jgi:hypothetical protein
MSASNEWAEWHLTPRGWEHGSCKTDFADETNVPKPKDCVLTCVFSEYLASAFSSMERKTEKTWQSPNSAEVNLLLKKFGDCPARIL